MTTVEKKVKSTNDEYAPPIKRRNKRRAYLLWSPLSRPTPFSGSICPFPGPHLLAEVMPYYNN